MARVFVGIGSNVGDRLAHLALARRGLAQLADTTLVGLSPVYETDPVGPIPQGKYLNAAAEIHTHLTHIRLLEALRRIEQLAGREAIDQRTKWGPRTLDLDLLLYDQQVIRSDQLVIPHPQMHDRWFVIKPLYDLDPNLVHPVLLVTIGQLLQRLPTYDQALANPINQSSGSQAP